jgi:hypothetical protein
VCFLLARGVYINKGLIAWSLVWGSGLRLMLRQLAVDAKPFFLKKILNKEFFFLSKRGTCQGKKHMATFVYIN